MEPLAEQAWWDRFPLVAMALQGEQGSSSEDDLKYADLVTYPVREAFLIETPLLALGEGGLTDPARDATCGVEHERPAEAVVMAMLQSQGWEPQVTFKAGGSTFRVDLMNRRLRLVIELDGPPHLADRKAARKDLLRDCALVRSGLGVIHVDNHVTVDAPYSIRSYLRRVELANEMCSDWTPGQAVRVDCDLGRAYRFRSIRRTFAFDRRGMGNALLGLGLLSPDAARGEPRHDREEWAA